MPRPNHRLLLAAALAAPILIASCKSSEAPKVATTVVITPSPVTFRTIGRTQQLAAVVKDQNGNPMTGATVTWGTTNAATATVSATGLVTSVASGIDTVTATSGSIKGSVAVTVAQFGATISKVSGDAQSGVVGQTLTLPLVVQVNDSLSHPASGVTVTFAAGAGSVGTSSAVTGANGQAQSTWTLGQAAGAQSATAASGGASGSPVAFGATASAAGAKSVALQSGGGQTVVTGQQVPIPPAVIVKDTFNNAVAGAAVTFSTTAGNGSVTGGSQLTSAIGVATVGSWTLGNAGTDTLTATVTGTGIGGNPLKVTATSLASAGAPAAVSAVAGVGQIGLVGWGVNVRPAVKVTDAQNLGVSGATVTFAVATGGGSGTNLVRTTDVNGVAQVGSWVLGGGAGVNTMTATVTGGGITGNPMTFADTGFAAGYTIVIQNYGPAFSAAVQSAMDSAVAKWQRLIYRPLGAASVNVAAGTCGTGTPALNTTVQNLLILAKFDSIDGPGKILGQAGPCLVRTVSGTTAVGVMQFDTADVATMITNGTLGEVMLHEMGHVIGFGTLWNNSPNAWLQLPSSPPGTINDTYFSGPKGRAAFDSVGGTSYTGGGSSPPAGSKVPVENCGTSPYVSPTCGSGTVNGHWREVVMTNELMTGFINAGSNPLSIVSVAAQEDLGYVVNYAAADSYVHTFTAPVVGGAPPLWLGDDIRHGPIYAIDAAGRVVRVIQPR